MLQVYLIYLIRRSSQTDVTGKTSLPFKIKGKSTVLQSSLNGKKVDISGNARYVGSITIFQDFGICKGTTQFFQSGTTTLTDASVQEFTITEGATLKSTMTVSNAATLSSILRCIKNQ